MSDSISRESVLATIEVMFERCTTYDIIDYKELMLEAVKVLPSADRPSVIIYGNEHNCIMTIFGECSYAETGCGDCAVVEKVRKALSADRPQGEWIDNGFGSKCSKCGFSLVGGEYNYCPNCGTKMINVSERWEHPCRCCALSKDICKIAFTDEYKHCIYIKGKE